MQSTTSRLDLCFKNMNRPARIQPNRVTGVTGLFSASLAGLLLASPGLTQAAAQQYDVVFQPSPSESVAGYVIHIGTSTGDYTVNADIGSPPEDGSEIAFRGTMDDALDRYIAVTSYNVAGVTSAFSNEIFIAAAPPAPPPPPDPDPDPGPDPDPDPDPGPDPDPDPSPDPDPDPGPDPDPDPVPEPGAALGELGLTADGSGMIRRILGGGALADLSIDSLATSGDIRPAWCDLDSDGDADLVLGFGSGSGGRLAMMHLENGDVTRVDTVHAGDSNYQLSDGQTRPACGDIDGDGRPEIVVGMGHTANRYLHIFDDESTGFAEYAEAGSVIGLYQVPVSSRVANIDSALVPALGDIDGDGRDELIVGFTGAGIREVAILDDGPAGFAVHPAMGSRGSLLRIARANEIHNSGGGTYPAAGDFDGDGLDEVVVGFGPGSGGWIALFDDTVRQRYDERRGFLMLPAGRQEYRESVGDSRPAMADIDGDGRAEIVVGFGPAGTNELQLFEDLYQMSATRIAIPGQGMVTSSDPDAQCIPAPPEN